MARILIIDDEELFRLALRQLLESWGHEVLEARDGREGLACYREALPDLVIMDIIMPDLEGLETIQALRREFPTCDILAVTGSKFADMDLLYLATKMGARQTLPKPLDWQSLAARPITQLVWPELLQAVHDLLASD
jgi:CheY-like chemotaxis protein